MKIIFNYQFELNLPEIQNNEVLAKYLNTRFKNLIEDHIFGLMGSKKEDLTFCGEDVNWFVIVDEEKLREENEAIQKVREEVEKLKNEKNLDLLHGKIY